MTEYSCSICEYTSDQKRHVARHIIKKKSCGIGTREIIEIPIDIKCDFCNKKFSTRETMKQHTKNTCKQKDSIKDTRKELEQKLREKTIIQQIDDKEDQGYVYLIKIYPYTDNIYKIGRTVNLLERLANYKRYKVVFITSCLNDIKCESDLLSIYRSKMTECKEMGNEYFYGSYREMKNIIQNYFTEI
jgi:hypothetical protein